MQALPASYSILPLVLACGLPLLQLIPAPGAQAQERRGPLAGLPSPPGAHLEQIKALGDNAWLELGSPAPDPQWGTARGRAWGGKAFALAPDIRGAYFTGEGIHAFVKPDGYGMNDYWVYDIHAHRWICIYPGTNVKTFKQQVQAGELKVNDQGLVVDTTGRLMPGHLIHAWGFLTYDTDRKKFVNVADSGYYKYFFPGTAYKSSDAKDVVEALELIQTQMKSQGPQQLSPWFYDSATGEFERFPASNSKPSTSDMGSHPQFFYIPTLKQYMLIGTRGRIATFDPDQSSWTSVETKGTGPAGGDISACYDSKRDRVYIGAIGPTASAKDKASIEDAILAYDVGTQTWIKPDAQGEAPQRWSTNRCSVHYDSANDMVLVIHYADRKVYAYDPAAATWLDPLAFPDHVKKHGSGHAFYDPALNVHFVFFANDSVDNGVMWAYRFREAAVSE